MDPLPERGIVKEVECPECGKVGPATYLLLTNFGGKTTFICCGVEYEEQSSPQKS